ncbi:MAG: alginate export family protein [Acidobacteria bacterium]|nr:alginate export family protein [Acidobacteriota bacterium]
MKHLIMRKTLIIFFLPVAAYVALFLPNSALAQSDDYTTLLARLTQLEQRHAALEAENQQLREQIVSLASVVLQKEAATPIQLAVLQAPSTTPAAAPRPAAEASPQKVQFGAEIRFRPETRSNFSQKNNVNAVLLQRIRLDARLRLNDNVTGLIQLQDSRLWGQEVSTISNETNFDLHQGYLQVANFFGPQLTLRAGRQELSYGNQRLIGAFGWDNIGRSFDAGKLIFGGTSLSADLFAGRLVDRRNSGRGDDSQDLIGLYGRIGQTNAKIGLEPYLLYLRDGLEIAGEKTGRESTKILTLGFRHFGNLGSGFSYDLENAFQVGQRGPDTQRAAALAAQARYRFGGRVAPEFGFEYDYATGDGKSTDGRSQEFHNLFPTNHLHYGSADYLGWRNMQDFKPYFSFALRPNMRAEFAYHRFLLVEKTGVWTNAGGAQLGIDRSGRLGTDLGHEIDITFTFPLYEHLRMLPGYSLFIPGKFARGTQGPRAIQFAYWQTLVTF